MAHYLARSEAIDEIVCADNVRPRAEAARRFASSRKARAAVLDAGRQRDLARALRETDMVVNAAHPRFNVSLMRAAAAAGVHYQDLAADYGGIVRQLAYSKAFARRGRVGLLQCGGSPGITNVLAREAVEALDGVDAIRLRLISRIDATRPLSLWSAEVALEDMEEPPAVYRDGRVVRLPPFSEEELFEFPAPFGPQLVVQHMHEEPLTFGRFLGKGLRYVDLKMGGRHVFQMREAASLGLLGREPVRVRKASVAPRDVLLALLPPTLNATEVTRLLRRGVLRDATGCHVVRVEGREGGSRRVLRYTCLGPSLREVQAWMPGATNLSYRVGVSAAIMVEMVGQELMRPSGAYPPEALETESRALFLEKIREHHLPFELAEDA